MVINKSGQVLFYTLMLASLVLVLALVLAPIIKQLISQTQTDMNCSDPSISEWDKATCYGWDIVLWFMIGLFIILAFIILGAKVMGG